MRLAEAVGLRIGDLHIQEDIPFVRLEEHASRTLKTAGSRRDIPLVGSALRARQRSAEENDGQFLFPRYCSATRCKADYASNTLNKWIKLPATEPASLDDTLRIKCQKAAPLVHLKLIVIA